MIGALLLPLASSTPPPGWVLLSRQTAIGTTSDWYRSSNQWSINSHDPTAAQYGVLDTLESMRAADGSFSLRLVWPQGAADGTALQSQTWRQTSNPVTVAGGVTGYQAINVPYTGFNFRGLERSEHSSLLDGAEGRYWWFSIGAQSSNTRHTGCSHSNPGFPGPVDPPRPRGGRGREYCVRVAELYACATDCFAPPSPSLPSPPAAPCGIAPAGCSCSSDAVPSLPTVTCRAVGDPHYRHFGGQRFDFYARGLYEHARFTILPCSCEVVIQVLLVKLIRGHPANSGIAGTAILVGDTTFEITGGGDVTVRREGQADVQLAPSTTAASHAFGGVTLLRERQGSGWAWRLMLPGGAGSYLVCECNTSRRMCPPEALPAR